MPYSAPAPDLNPTDTLWHYVKITEASPNQPEEPGANLPSTMGQNTFQHQVQSWYIRMPK